MSQAPTPARVRLPRLDHPPSTIFEFLCARFSHVAPEIWRARVRAGDVSTAGTPISLDTPYRPGITIFYFREVAAEPAIPFAETVLYEDDRLLVADKPHFIPVTPAGDVVNECLLFRLQRRTGLADLAPIHRLDRDTAGLVLFAKRIEDRAPYAQLFEAGKVERNYLAIAQVNAASAPRKWLVESRIEPEPGSFRMRSLPGEVNARTHIELLEVQDGLGRFELRPATGKKHQLRLHMLALGFPILNDLFYPELSRTGAGDFSRPLQLLARGLQFDDPGTGLRQSFETRLRLLHREPR